MIFHEWFHRVICLCHSQVLLEAVQPGFIIYFNQDCGPKLGISKVDQAINEDLSDSSQYIYCPSGSLSSMMLSSSLTLAPIMENLPVLLVGVFGVILAGGHH